MSAVGSRSRVCRFVGAGVSAVLLVATLVLASGPAEAATVSIHDDSHVLDVTRVQNAAATLSDPVAVYTTTKDADDKAAFDRETQAKVTAPTVVVIAVNTQSHHLAIRTGAKSRITQQAAAAATQTFIDSYRGSPDYTAAIGSMRTAIQAGGPARNETQRRTTTRSSNGVSIGGLLCLLAVVAAVVALLVRRRRQSRQAPTQIAGYDATSGYGQPGYGPAAGYGPGYGPGAGYGPGYGGPGVGPWVAGGVGAAAGGLLGYELGRNEGREEEHEREERSDQGNDDGGFGGGGADGDFGDDAGSASGGGDF